MQKAINLSALQIVDIQVCEYIYAMFSCFQGTSRTVYLDKYTFNIFSLYVMRLFMLLLLLQIFRIISYATSILRVRPSQMGLELWLHKRLRERSEITRSHSLATDTRQCTNSVEYVAKFKKNVWISVNL